MWILLSVLSTISLSSKNLLSKFGAGKTNEYVNMWAMAFFTLPVAGIALLFSDFEISDNKFWLLIGLRIILESIALVAFFRALKFKSASFVISIMSLQPALTIITTFFISDQKVPLLGIGAILVIVAANFMLFQSEKKLTNKEDMPNLIKATLLIFTTTLLFSVLDPLHGEIIEVSNQFTYFFVSELCFTVVYSILVGARFRKEFKQTFSNKKNGLLIAGIGVSFGFELLTLFGAITSSDYVSYVSAIRSANIALTAILAFFLFKEKLSRLKLFSIALMTLGVLILVLSK